MSIYLLYVYLYQEPFPNFSNISEENGLDICDVIFTGGGGRYIIVTLCNQGGGGVWKG